MFAWIFRKKQPYQKDEILNDGLNLSLAFGKNWLKPIQDRLKKRYPGLTQQELDEFNKACTEARDFGQKKLYAVAETDSVMMNQDEFNSYYLSTYPWINKKNLKYVYSQGLYYVFKDFGKLPSPNK